MDDIFPQRLLINILFPNYDIRNFKKEVIFMQSYWLFSFFFFLFYIHDFMFNQNII